MLEPVPWQSLGDCLSVARQSRWLTQLQVAKRSGMSQSSYSQIERGLIRPRPGNVLRLALALGIGIDILATKADYSLERILLTGTPR
jgi:transcriptional regulator with XRE-family HTH domain